jgi:predicted nuclease with TOPRIM domain
MTATMEPEFDEFIKNSFFVNLSDLIETIRKGDNVVACNERLGNDLKTLQGMFDAKKKEQAELVRRNEETQRECKELKETLEELRTSLLTKREQLQAEIPLEEDVDTLPPHCPVSWALLCGLEQNWKKECELLETNKDLGLQQTKITMLIGQLYLDCATFYRSKNIPLNEHMDIDMTLDRGVSFF